jgi:hypothetical protein
LPANLEAHRVARKVSDKFTKATPSSIIEAFREIAALVASARTR